MKPVSWDDDNKQRIINEERLKRPRSGQIFVKTDS